MFRLGPVPALAVKPCSRATVSQSLTRRCRGVCSLEGFRSHVPAVVLRVSWDSLGMLIFLRRSLLLFALSMVPWSLSTALKVAQFRCDCSTSKTLTERVIPICSSSKWIEKVPRTCSICSFPLVTLISLRWFLLLFAFKLVQKCKSVEFGRLSSTICWSCIDLVHLLLGVLLSMVPSSTMHFRAMLGYTCLDTQRVDSS